MGQLNIEGSGNQTTMWHALNHHWPSSSPTLQSTKEHNQSDLALKLSPIMLSSSQAVCDLTGGRASHLYPDLFLKWLVA